MYDRFGRLLYGSESVPKDVLDFIVFEKHMSDTYGKWRIHGKIVPSWKIPDSQFRGTTRVPEQLKQLALNNKASHTEEPGVEQRA